MFIVRVYVGVGADMCGYMWVHMPMRVEMCVHMCMLVCVGAFVGFSNSALFACRFILRIRLQQVYSSSDQTCTVSA
jgi:hypothetical protein